MNKRSKILLDLLIAKINYTDYFNNRYNNSMIDDLILFECNRNLKEIDLEIYNQVFNSNLHNNQSIQKGYIFDYFVPAFFIIDEINNKSDIYSIDLDNLSVRSKRIEISEYFKYRYLLEKKREELTI